jgi:hypothetical protein
VDRVEPPWAEVLRAPLFRESGKRTKRSAAERRNSDVAELPGTHTNQNRMAATESACVRRTDKVEFDGIVHVFKKHRFLRRPSGDVALDFNWRPPSPGQENQFDLSDGRSFRCSIRGTDPRNGVLVFGTDTTNLFVLRGAGRPGEFEAVLNPAQTVSTELLILIHLALIRMLKGFSVGASLTSSIQTSSPRPLPDS